MAQVSTTFIVNVTFKFGSFGVSFVLNSHRAMVLVGHVCHLIPGIIVHVSPNNSATDIFIMSFIAVTIINHH